MVGCTRIYDPWAINEGERGLWEDDYLFGLSNKKRIDLKRFETKEVCMVALFDP